MTADQYKGWFVVPGVQHGDRTFDEQWLGLEDLATGIAAGGPFRVLDIGAAEGLIAREFCLRGASEADCILIRVEEAEAGRVLCADVKVRFFLADVRKRAELNALALHASYDVVLLLSIVHKMIDPFELLQWASKKATSAIAVRVPTSIYQSRGNRTIRPRTCDLIAQMRELGWFLVCSPPTCRGEYLGLFAQVPDDPVLGSYCSHVFGRLYINPFYPKISHS